MNILIFTTLAFMSWALWVRRATWRCRWEVAPTLSITLQAVAILLMMPATSNTLGLWLYEQTGRYNLEDHIGHITYLIAASCIVYNTVGRLDDDVVFRRRFALLVEKPGLITIPVLAALFTLGPNEYAAVIIEPVGGWCNLYWATLCLGTMWLFGLGMWGLSTLRLDTRSRKQANLHGLACLAGMLACLARLFDLFVAGDPIGLVWLFVCLCALLMSAASAVSWRHKSRPLVIPDGGVRV